MHIGLSKTGTTSIQAALAESGLNVIVDAWQAWDAAGCIPLGCELSEWDGDGRWFARVESEQGRDLVISQEEISRARPARIPRLLDVAAPDVVVITHVAPSLALPRFHRELCKPSNGETRGYERWRDELDWRSPTPGFDGIAVRPDIVAAWWRDAGANVRLLDTTTYAVSAFFGVLELGDVPELRRNVAAWPTKPDPSLAEADLLVAAALASESIASLEQL